MDQEPGQLRFLQLIGDELLLPSWSQLGLSRNISHSLSRVFGESSANSGQWKEGGKDPSRDMGESCKSHPLPALAPWSSFRGACKEAH